jgi:predicted permease
MQIRKFSAWLRWWRDAHQERQDLQDEMALHKELRARQISSNSRLNPEEASAMASRKFGNHTWLVEEATNSWKWIWLEDLAKDVRHALRAMRAHPIFTVVAIVTLGIGIGANTAIFSVINALLLRMLPVPNSDRIYNVSCDGQPNGAFNTGDAATSFSFHVFDRLRNTHPELWDVMAYVPLGNNKISVTVNNFPVEGSVHMVSGNFFTGLEAPIACGRPILPSDEGASIAVLNAGFAASRFGSACAAIGRQVHMRGAALTVVGIAGSRFEGVTQTATDVWIPFQHRPELNAWGSTDGQFTKEANWWCLLMIARLKPGITAALVTAAVTPGFEQAAYEPLGGKPRAGEKPTQLHLREARGFATNEEGRDQLLVVQAMVGMLLLIACGNVSMLLSVRNSARIREFSVKRAIGGSSVRLFRQLLVESGVLVACGTAVGIGLAFAAARALGRWAEIDISVAPDGTVLLLTLGLSVLVALVFGIAPALVSSRVPLAETMKASAATSYRDHSRVPSGTVVTVFQLGFSLALLAATALLMRTVQNLEHVRLGLDTQGLVVFGISAPANPTGENQTIGFFQELTEKLRTLPQVLSVSLSGNRIGSGWSNNTSAVVDGKYVERRPNHMRWNNVGPQFFTTLRTRLVEGRDFNDADAQTSPKVAIVNRTFVEQFLAGRNAIGRTVSFTKDQAFTVVGVVANSKYTGITEEDTPMAWFPYTQVMYGGTMQMELRVRGDLASALSEVRRAVAQSVPDTALLQPMTQRQQFDEGIGEQLLIGRLSVSFTVVAAFLVCIGLYGTTSFHVMRRFREIGVRMALGADRARIVRTLLLRSAAICGVGIAIGLPMAFWMAHVLRSMLFGVEATDVLSFTLAAMGLFAICLLASFVPARRAARVDPMVALRYE